MGTRQSKVSETEKSASNSPEQPVERYLGICRASETGWERVKSLFIFRRNGPFAEELKEIPKVVIASTIVGFFFGGFIGSRQMADKFIMLNQHSKFSSVMQAQRELHSAAMLGFARHALKWGGRLGSYAGVFTGAAVLLATYRDKEDAWNYIAAGGLIGGLYRINWGFMPFVGGTTLGLLVTLPFGMILLAMEKLLVKKEVKLKAREKLFLARCERQNFWKVKQNEASAMIEGIGEGDGMVEHFKTVPKPKKKWWKWKWFLWKQEKEKEKQKQKKLKL